jgi:hypothetical protein
MSTPAQDRKIAAPIAYPDNAEFWAAAGQGRLLVRCCADCGKFHWYPRPQCPHCMSGRVEWQDAAGTGSVYSYSVTRRGVPVPYAIAYVRLDEGVTLLTNIVDCDLDAIRIDQKVRVVFKPSDGGPPVPMFAPA